MSHDCAICISEIGDKNKVVTECGHVFHASCLMEHVAYNGYGCPCCRDNMVNKDEDEDKDKYNDNDMNVFDERQLSINSIIEHIHKSYYSYEDLVRMICLRSSIHYKNYIQDMYLLDAFYDDIQNVLETENDDSDGDIMGSYEIDSV